MDMYMDNFLDNDATRRYARGQQATTMTVFFLTFYSMFLQPQLKEN